VATVQNIVYGYFTLNISKK